MVKLQDGDNIATQCVHAGVEPEPIHGSVNPPVHLTTTYVQPDVAKPKTHDYVRAGNPTRDALETALAALEHGSHGLVFSSGLSAMDAIVRTMSAGDHVVCADDAYGGSIRLLRQVASKGGIETTFVDTSDNDAVAAAMQSNTKWVILETPTNPLLRISDIKAVAGIAHDGDAKLLVDNTFQSPILQNPLDDGADVVFHSATKYLGGHSDVLAGVLVTSNDELAAELRFLQLAVGAVLPPFDCFLLHRGIKTLNLRIREHDSNARIIANRLANRLGDDNVYYPGLETHAGHDVHQRQSKGGGGMVSFRTPTAETARAVATNTRLWQLAESLGAVESLIQVPAAMTHASVPKEMRDATGLTDGLIRLSVGIEDVEDLWADLEQALDAM